MSFEEGEAGIIREICEESKRSGTEPLNTLYAHLHKREARSCSKFYRKNDQTFYSGAALEKPIVGTTKRLIAVLCRGAIYCAQVRAYGAVRPYSVQEA